MFLLVLFIRVKNWKQKKIGNNFNVHQYVNVQTNCGHNGILFGNKKQQITETCYNMDKSKNRYAK